VRWFKRKPLPQYAYWVRYLDTGEEHVFAHRNNIPAQGGEELITSIKRNYGRDAKIVEYWEVTETPEHPCFDQTIALD
jgi:hypothetical protein